MDCQGVQGRARGKATGPEHGRKGALCRALGALPPSAYSGPLAFPPGPSLDPLAVGHNALRLLYVGVGPVHGLWEGFEYVCRWPRERAQGPLHTYTLRETSQLCRGLQRPPGAVKGLETREPLSGQFQIR